MSASGPDLRTEPWVPVCKTGPVAAAPTVLAGRVPKQSRYSVERRHGVRVGDHSGPGPQGGTPLAAPLAGAQNLARLRPLWLPEKIALGTFCDPQYDNNRISIEGFVSLPGMLYCRSIAGLLSEGAQRRRVSLPSRDGSNDEIPDKMERVEM